MTDHALSRDEMEPTKGTPVPQVIFPPHTAVVVKRIIELSAKAQGCSVHELMGPLKYNYLCEARCAAYRLMRKHTRLSIPQIARKFGRDHSSISHSLRHSRQNQERVSAIVALVDAHLFPAPCEQCGQRALGDVDSGDGRNNKTPDGLY